MKDDATPLKTWQIMRSIRRILSDSFLQKTYKIELRQIQRWSCDPKTSESHGANPLDRVEVVLDRLMEAGREDVARRTVARMAHIVGCELRVLQSATPGNTTIADECLDDLPALAQFHDALRSSVSSIEDVRDRWQQAKQELDENYELFIRKTATGAGRC